MSASDLNDTILAYVVSYGALAVGVVVFLAALGAPLPATVAVLASGAFIQQGVLSPWSVLVVLGFVVLGDSISYGLGRLLRVPIVERYGQTATWRRAEEQFQQRGGLAVYLTRWLLTPLSVPMNLTAGGVHYPFPRFLAFAAAGELTWLALYGSLGYAFGSQWEYVSALITDFSGSFFGLALLAVGLYWLVRLTIRSSRAGDAPADV